MNLNIETQAHQDGATHIVLTGRLDTQTAPQLESVIRGTIGPDTNRVVYDLAAPEYISSAGIRAILGTRKILENTGGSVAAADPQPGVRKVLEIVKALPLETVFRSWDEADRYFDTMQMRATDEEAT